jgi:hypothetical protein
MENIDTRTCNNPSGKATVSGLDTSAQNVTILFSNAGKTATDVSRTNNDKALIQGMTYRYSVYKANHSGNFSFHKTTN